MRVNKRSFLKTLSATLVSSVIAPLSAWMAKQKLFNWAGNLFYSTDRLHEAASSGQVRSLVRSQDKLKVLGTRHCFNSIADSRDNLLSLKPMHEVVALDAVARTVTVDAGMTYGQLCPYLDSKGFALHNLASLPHISIAGACSTATHGSGEKNGNLPTAVSAVEIVTAAGDLVKLSRESDGEAFRGAVVGLGALGAITRITLDIQPTYAVRQYVYENLPIAQMKDHFDEIQASEDSPRRQNSSAPGWHRRIFTRLPSFLPRTARSRWAWPALGTTGCRTFAWVSRRAPGRNSSRNTLCLAATPSTRLWRWNGCATR
jgi:xylitol oxidase